MNLICKIGVLTLCVFLGGVLLAELKQMGANDCAKIMMAGFVLLVWSLVS